VRPISSPLLIRVHGGPVPLECIHPIAVLDALHAA
jgi:hypothetical protein